MASFAESLRTFFLIRSLAQPGLLSPADVTLAKAYLATRASRVHKDKVDQLLESNPEGISSTHHHPVIKPG